MIVKVIVKMIVKMEATGTDPISTAEEISVVRREGKTPVCKESLPTASTIAKFATVQRESNVHFLHIGASLKDLGKKLFAFSKLEISPEVILNVISKTEVL